MDIRLAATLGFLFLTLTLVPVTIFIVLFALRSNWSNSVVGRQIMFKTVAIWLLLALNTYANLVGPLLGGWLIVGVPALLLVMYSVQLYNLIRVQRGDLTFLNQAPIWVRFYRLVREKVKR